MKLLNAATKPVVVVLLLVVMCVMSASSTRRHHRRHYRHHGGQNTAQSGSSRASPTAAVRGGDQPTPWPSNCSHCSIRQAKKNYRLATIKNEILRKLHLRSPPNITRRRLPDIPPLRDLIGDDMVSDSPDEFSDHEYHATTVKMMLFPTRGITQLFGFRSFSTLKLITLYNVAVSSDNASRLTVMSNIFQ